jgi:hypothetical protein
MALLYSSRVSPRKMFGPKMVEVTGLEIKLPKELQIFLSMPNIINVANSRTRLAAHVPNVGYEKYIQNFG